MNPRYLRNPQDVPRNGWLARQPETGTVIKGLNLPAAIEAVRKYRVANKLPLDGNLRRQVEIQICDTMPEDEACRKCRFLDPEDEKNPRHLRAWKSGRECLWNFALAIKGVLAAAAAGSSLHVTKEEATRRAGICAQCKWNLPISNCWGCGELGSAYRELVGSLSTAKDPMLESCDVCCCQNRTQIWFTKEVLGPVAESQKISADQFPDWCWKKELLQ